jgi:multidrug transporter EmrE-like cation transporter
MNWVVWCFFVVITSVTYQTSMKIFSGRVPLFLYTAIVGVTMLLISAIGLSLTYKSIDFSVIDQRKIYFSFWLGIATFMIELSYFYLYKNNAPVSLSRMFILAGSTVVLLLVGVLFFKERINLNQMIGFILSLAGMLFIIKK